MVKLIDVVGMVTFRSTTRSREKSDRKHQLRHGKSDLISQLNPVYDPDEEDAVIADLRIMIMNEMECLDPSLLPGKKNSIN